MSAICSALCCLGSSISICGRVITMTSSKASRMMYFGLFCLILVFAWISRTEAHWYVDSASSYSCKKGQGYDYKECLNKVTVYRISLGGVLFHTVMLLFTYGIQSSTEPRAKIQNSWWIIKLPLFVLCQVAAFYVPQSGMLDYARTCIFGAAVFILIQCVLLVDLGYSLNEEWVEKGYFATILLLAGTLYGFFFAFLVLGFYYFTGNGCDTNNAFMSITVISAVIYTLMSVSERINKGILPPAVIACYTSYLSLSSMMSEPKGKCSPGQADNPYLVIAGAIFTLGSVAYAANRTAGGGDDFTGKQKVSSVESGSSGASGDADAADDEKDGVMYNYSFFHFVYALACMFVAMIMVGWDIDVKKGGNSNSSLDNGWTSTWIKISTQWVTIIVFFWTLIAPILFPERFGGTST